MEIKKIIRKNITEAIYGIVIGLWMLAIIIKFLNDWKNGDIGALLLYGQIALTLFGITLIGGLKISRFEIFKNSSFASPSSFNTFHKKCSTILEATASFRWLPAYLLSNVSDICQMTCHTILHSYKSSKRQREHSHTCSK